MKEPLLLFIDRLNSILLIRKSLIDLFNVLNYNDKVIGQNPFLMFTYFDCMNYYGGVDVKYEFIN